MLDRPNNPTQETPITILYNALEAAKSGAMPPFTPESFVQSLHLEGVTPDGRTLNDRLLGSQTTSDDLRPILFITEPLRELIHSTNERTANSAQEVIALCLGTAVTRQVMREREACGMARVLISKSKRTDLISDDVRQRLRTKDFWQSK